MDECLNYVESFKIILRTSRYFAILIKLYSPLFLLCWRGNIITVSFKRLWKKLIDLNMSKTQLREKAGITTNVIAKKGRNEDVEQMVAN